MIELEGKLLCPKCGEEMIFFVDQVNPGPDRNWGHYQCPSKYRARVFINMTPTYYFTIYDNKWTIDGVEYTDEECERYKKLKAFL
jgi:hypothetical protein